jgi:predicted O-methyltransferase YrrM
MKLAWRPATQNPASPELTGNPWDQWFLGKELSTDWTSMHFPIWSECIGELRERITRVLEIGSWEGRSAIFFLEFLPRCRITCVDTFKGEADYEQEWLDAIPFVESRFDANVSKYKPRVEKIRGRSAEVLDRLAAADRKFELIYIDGCHRRDEVMIDSLLSWRLLEIDGLLIWDDYGGGGERPDREKVQPAVDLFLKWYSSDCEERHRGYQIIVRKLR